MRREGNSIDTVSTKLFDERHAHPPDAETESFFASAILCRLEAEQAGADSMPRTDRGKSLREYRNVVYDSGYYVARRRFATERKISRPMRDL